MNKHLLMVLGFLLALSSCGGRAETGTPSGEGQPIELKYAENLRLWNHGDWVEAHIVNPWDTATVLQRLALVDSLIDPSTCGIPAGHTVVRTPLRKSLVTTTVIMGLLEELGALDEIAGITDRPYIKNDSLLGRIAREEIEDCGSWMAPDIERIMKLGPDAILLSPYQDAGSYGNLLQLGTPVVYAADYTENSPLGRAEWMKFYGMLYGADNKADSVFSKVESTYNRLKAEAGSLTALQGRPAVMIDTPYMGIWYVNGKGSATDTFIADAGARNPFGRTVDGSSVGITPEKFLMEAKDADVWVLRYLTPDTLSLKALGDEDNLYRRFSAYRNGNVWGCNTALTEFFEETPFHPEYFLADLVQIFHPSATDNSLRYFHKLK